MTSKFPWNLPVDSLLFIRPRIRTESGCLCSPRTQCSLLPYPALYVALGCFWYRARNPSLCNGEYAYVINPLDNHWRCRYLYPYFRDKETEVQGDLSTCAETLNCGVTEPGFNFDDLIWHKGPCSSLPHYAVTVCIQSSCLVWCIHIDLSRFSMAFPYLLNRQFSAGQHLISIGCFLRESPKIIKDLITFSDNSLHDWKLSALTFKCLSVLAPCNWGASSGANEAKIPTNVLF